MKKTKKTPAKNVAASKTKRPAPVKKPVKVVAKSKKAPEKKVTAKAAPDKKIAAKKTAAPAPVVKKDDSKKPTNPAASKVALKKDVQAGAPVAKKPDAARPGATSAAAAAKASPAPIKVEPKIIETPQPEFKSRIPDEELFSVDEIEHFRNLLLAESNKILAKARKAMEEGNIQIDRNEMLDEVDQASAMIDQNLTFRLLDRDRKLLSEIDHALAKLDAGDYGYCEGTGEPIPKRRLELRPWCRHSVKYKEKLERMKKSGRGVVDEDEI